jgi:hypothetical protein
VFKIIVTDLKRCIFCYSGCLAVTHSKLEVKGHYIQTFSDSFIGEEALGLSRPRTLSFSHGILQIIKIAGFWDVPLSSFVT